MLKGRDGKGKQHLIGDLPKAQMESRAAREDKARQDRLGHKAGLQDVRVVVHARVRNRSRDS
jgi:hypothetical protein